MARRPHKYDMYCSCAECREKIYIHERYFPRATCHCHICVEEHWREYDRNKVVKVDYRSRMAVEDYKRYEEFTIEPMRLERRYIEPRDKYIAVDPGLLYGEFRAEPPRPLPPLAPPKDASKYQLSRAAKDCLPHLEDAYKQSGEPNPWDERKLLGSTDPLIKAMLKMTVQANLAREDERYS